MAQSKATKKFEKNRLGDALKRRKDFAKVKQRHQIKAKQKSKRATESGRQEDGAAEDESRPSKKQKQGGQDLADMTVDDFFAGGFEVPAKPTKNSRGSEKTGASKRKRTTTDGDSPVASDGEESSGDVGSEDEEGGQDDEMEAHKQELKALAEKDPEFYKYLQENDTDLLDFAEKSNLAEIDELSGSDDDAGDTKTGKKKKQKEEVMPASGEVTIETIKKWTEAMKEKHSLRAMREVVLAFRAAAHLNEEDGKEYKYTISNADVYHEVLLGALQYVPDVLNHHLPIKDLANGKIRISMDSKKYRTMTPLLKSHATSIQHLLENLSDAATLKITLGSLLSLLPYLLSFKKLIRELSRVVVEIWSDSAHSEAARISAFLILRRLVVIGDPSIKEHVLRSTYQGLIKGSRTTTIHNLAGINLMKNSALELWGIVDANIAYTSGFTFIRQLAIHLRNSIKNNANDSYKTVYNWQYVHSLDFWSRVLSTHCEVLREASSGKESSLRPLIYPLTQVTLGALRLIPTAAYFPLRFQLVRSLLRLSRTTHTYIPLATPLYEVLTLAEMKKPPKPSTLKPLDFETSIRATKAYLRTRIYQDGVGEQFVELLGEFFNIWTKSIAFPELALPVIVMLKRWLKEVSPFNNNTKQPQQKANGGSARGGKRNSRNATGPANTAAGNHNNKLNGSLVLFIQKLEANSRWIEERRAKVEFAPNDRAGVEGFLKEVEWNKTPLGAFVEGQRKAREERRKMLEAGRKEEEARKGKGKGRREEEDEEGSADEGSDGEEEEEGEMEMEDEMEEEDELEEEFEDEDEMEEE